jgi:hypothetical protein
VFAIFEEDKKAIDAVLRQLLAVPVERRRSGHGTETGAPSEAKR